MEAVLAESARITAPRVEVVWTGPEATTGSARDTAAVVRELFCQAQKSVLIAGYTFDRDGEIFAPLFEVTRTRKLDVSLFIEIPRAPASHPCLDRYLTEYVDYFLARNIELGVLVEHEGFGRALLEQWRMAVSAGVFRQA